MGSNNGDDDEKPVHNVNIDYDFEIGKYEVPNQEFVKFLNDKLIIEPEWILNKVEDAKNHIWKLDSVYSVDDGYENYPVVTVSWFGAKAYAEWLSIKTGENYRLPTEAEWEYVGRAGTITRWSFGDSYRDLEKYAWYRKTRSSKIYKVGARTANQWGVYDMHGNVWEWNEDWYLKTYNEMLKDGNSNQVKKENFRVLRGGSWHSYNIVVDSATRSKGNPSNRYDTVGFRLLRISP